MGKFRARIRWTVDGRDVDMLINIPEGETLDEATVWLVQNMDSEESRIIEVYEE
jgi:hypothetical protein